MPPPEEIRNPIAPGQNEKARTSDQIERKSVKFEHDHGIFIGRVEDVFSNTYSCMVNVFRWHKNIRCMCVGSMMGSWGGSGEFKLPEIGTTVLISVNRDAKVGFVLGCLPIADYQRPMKQLSHEAGHHYSEEVMNSQTFKMDDYQDVSGGTPIDIFPGDWSHLNEFNVGLAVLRLMTFIKASDMSKIECFFLNNLTRIAGYNMDVFTCMGESRTRDDWGDLTFEMQGTSKQFESLGQMDKATPAFTETGYDLKLGVDGEKSALVEKQKHQTGRWRYKLWHGALASMFQYFICAPAQEEGSLDNTKDDIGLGQVLFEDNGQVCLRSLVGGGIIKDWQIAVPKKLKEADDPEGDKEITKPTERKPFQFSTKYDSMGVGCQIRDYFAWLFNKVSRIPMTDRTKDWKVPDEATCDTPTPGDSKPAGIGKFFMEQLKDMEIGTGTTKDTSPLKAKQGQAHILTLPDGSISIRDAWGSSIELRGGHIYISCAKDVQILAGRNLVGLGGNDVVFKARESMDLTTTEKQIRIKSQGGLYMHAEQEGMTFSLGKPTTGFVDKEGEDSKVPGFFFKADNGAFNVNCQRMNLAVQQAFQVCGQDGTETPLIYFRGSQFKFWSKYPAMFFQLAGKYTFFSQGDILTDGNVYCSKDVRANGSMWCAGMFRGNFGSMHGKDHINAKIHFDFNFDSYGVPAFNDTAWKNFAKPFVFDDQKKYKFTFRSSKECNAQEGYWFQSQWQRDLEATLTTWSEKAINDTYPYPGKIMHDDSRYVMYQEKYVKPGGKPNSRDTIKDEAGGTFTPSPIDSMRVHKD